MNLRIATDAERQRYERELYPLQDRVFTAASAYDELALARGTALARAHLQHRFSEDIDLFTQLDRVDTLANAVLRRIDREGIAYEVDRRSSTFVRAIAIHREARLQIDFAVDAPLVEPPKPSSLGGVRVYGLRDLAANKISAFEDRAEAKDVVDLYFLTKHVRWDVIFADAQSKRVPPAYDALELILAQPVVGEAILTRGVSDAEMGDFLSELHTELEREVKKKTQVARSAIATIVSDLLWDAPRERRVVDEATVPLLRRRAARLSKPKRVALEEVLAGDSGGAPWGKHPL